MEEEWSFSDYEWELTGVLIHCGAVIMTLTFCTT
jgi:hypothetical protein